MSFMQNFRGKTRRQLLKQDFSTLFFRHNKTQKACQLFLQWLKKQNGGAQPSKISKFAYDLQDGKHVNFTYRRENFYATILNRLKDLGFIQKTIRYPRQTVYVPIIQPIPSRGPIQGSFWGLAYLIAEKWNQEFMKE